MFSDLVDLGHGKQSVYAIFAFFDFSEVRIAFKLFRQKKSLLQIHIEPS